MKLLIICPYFFEPHRWMISGYKTALELSKTISVVVLTTGKPPFQNLNNNLKIYRIKDIFLPDPINFSFIPGLFKQLKYVIKTEQPNCYLINKNMFYSSLAIIYLRLAGKNVVTQVDTFPGINWFSRNRLVNIVLWIYARTVGILLLKLSHSVVLLHEGLIPVARRYKLRYTVIHNGVDIEAVRKANPANLPQVNKNVIRVAYVGRLESVKGYLDLLAVAKDLTQDRKNLIFYFIGNTEGKEELLKKYSSSHIIFLGHRTDVLSLLKRMDVFVLPSYSEGLPNALMEAMACGCACIASDVGGVKVLIKNDQTGLLCRAGDCADIKEKLLKLITDSTLRNKISHEGRQLIEKDFNWQIVAGQLITLLEAHTS